MSKNDGQKTEHPLHSPLARRQVLIGLASAAATFRTALADAPSTPSAPYSAMHINPDSIDELLANIKLGFDNLWYLQPEFYTVENLKPFFGMMDMTVYDNSKDVSKIRFAANSWNRGRNVGVIIKPSIEKLNLLDSLDSSVGGSLFIKKQVQGSMSITFGDKIIRFDKITSVFGNDYVIDKWWPMPFMHYVPPPVTSPLGLKKIDFKFDLEKYKAYVVIYTHPNGAVNFFEIDIIGEVK
jgi:hypothetical protein